MDIVQSVAGYADDRVEAGSAEYLPHALGRTGLGLPARCTPSAPAATASAADSAAEIFTSSLERLCSIFSAISRASDWRSAQLEIFLPQLDEMYAPGCPGLHQTEKLAAKNRFGLSLRRKAPAVRYGTELHGVESILHVS